MIGLLVSFAQFFRKYLNLPEFGKIGMFSGNIDVTNG